MIYEEDKSFRPAYAGSLKVKTAKQVGWCKRDGRPVVKCPYTHRIVVLDWDRCGEEITVDNRTLQVDRYTFRAPSEFYNRR
jgi:hypothetical protein